MQLKPSTRIPSARATMTSGTVDIPTASAPRTPSMRTSAARLVRRTEEPGVDTFAQHDSLLPRDVARDRRERGSYGDDMSGNRTSPRSSGPTSGLRNIRLM